MLKQKLTSRKFWVAVATAIFVILTQGLGFDVDQDVYWKIVALALGYIFGEAAVDMARAKTLTSERPTSDETEAGNGSIPAAN